MNENTKQLHAIYHKHKDKFDGAFHTLLWHIFINEIRALDAKTSAFTVIIAAGRYELAIVDDGEKGYQKTPAVFKTSNYKEACEIADILNDEVFGLTKMESAQLQVQSFHLKGYQI